MWEDKEIAAAHYEDLLKIKERLKSENSANEYRMQIIEDLINIAESESRGSNVAKPSFYR